MYWHLFTLLHSQAKMFIVQQMIVKAFLMTAFVSAVCDLAVATNLKQVDTNPTNSKDKRNEVNIEERSMSLTAARRDVNNNGACSNCNQSGYCLTTTCVDIASRINSYIDYSKDPCEDFYQFACGNWIKNTILPEGKSSLDIFELLVGKVRSVIKSLLEEEDKPTDLSCVKKTKDFYKLCMNMNAIDSAGDKPMKKILINEFGGWPLTTPCWSEDRFDFVQTMLNLSQYSCNSIFTILISADFVNNTKYSFMLYQGGFGMPSQKYYLKPRNDTMLMAYENYIYDVGQLLCFADPNTARQEVADIVDFEIRLANFFDWRTFVKSLLSKPEIGINFTDDDIVIDLTTPYFKKLGALLAVTSKRTLANYLIWKFIMPSVKDMGADYQKGAIAYNKALHGTTISPRSDHCISLTTKKFSLVVARLYIKDNYDAESKAMTLAMIDKIRDSFNNILDELDWMDEVTKRFAREKSDKLTSKIGYPDKVTNDTYMEDYHKNYTIKDHYLETYLAVLKVDFYRTMRILSEVVDKDIWYLPPTDVNAYYNLLGNEIVFLAGILQPPFFNKSYHMSLNYGALGSYIGHELTHGFDKRGSDFDSTGTLLAWWNETAKQRFKEKSDCFVQQYNNFTVPEINMQVNGGNTLNENIADNGGLKQSFRSYRKWVEDRGSEEPLLPGLDFTNNQLLFINYAQALCDMYTKQYAIFMVQSDVHSLKHFRVIGALQNSPDFARVFNCPLNSNMNPENKCGIW